MNNQMPQMPQMPQPMQQPQQQYAAPVPQQQAPKQYVGGAELKDPAKGWFKISFSAQDLQDMMNALNQRGYVNLNMNQRQQPSQYGQTHSITIDTWQPQPQAAPAAQAPQMGQVGGPVGVPVQQQMPQPMQQPVQQPMQQPMPQQFQ